MDFGGLPELVRTFLQVAAGAADIPVRPDGSVEPPKLPPMPFGNERLRSDPSPAPLRRTHPDATYEADPKARRSLEYWRKQPSNGITESLRNGAKEPLVAKSDTSVMNGNTRIKVLQERGYPVDTLPRLPQST